MHHVYTCTYAGEFMAMWGCTCLHLHVCEGGAFGNLLVGNLPNILDEVSLIFYERDG